MTEGGHKGWDPGGAPTADIEPLAMSPLNQFQCLLIMIPADDSEKAYSLETDEVMTTR